MLQGIAGICPKKDADTICHLLLDSLGNRNEGINKQLQRVISIADENVEPTQYRTKRQDSFTAIDDSHVQLSTIREAFTSNGIVCDTCNNATVRRMQEHVAATYHLHVTTSTSEASPPVSSESKPRTATASIPTSEDVRTTVVLTFWTRCRRS